jgi:hypothetical protein
MTLEEIRAASAEHFRRDKLNAENVTETTPGKITDAAKRFAATLSDVAPVFVPVVADDHGLYAWCSDGVHEKIKADGGSIVFGWTIWEWPGAMLTAEFHSVWRDDVGDLFDITPKPGGQTRILFVPDHSYAQNFNFDDRPRNRRFNLHANTDRSAELATMKKGLSDGQQRYEEGRAAKAGLSLDDWLKRKLPSDPLAKAVDELIAACAIFEEHFDSLGVAGDVKVDGRFKVLLLQRLAAQERMKKLLRAELPNG